MKFIHFFFITVGLFTNINVRSQNLTLRSQLPYTGKTCANICGYVDSVGNEYALVAVLDGTSIVNVTNPFLPVEVKFIPGLSSTYREIKVRGNFAYVTNENNFGLQIINLRSLPAAGFVTSRYWNGGVPFSRSHALHIDNNYLYVYGANASSGNGAVIFDLSDPWTPPVAGLYESLSAPYIHDGYVKDDTLYACHINDGFFSIVDFSDKANPIEIGMQYTPGNTTHNSWLSTNGNVLYTTDEISDGYLTSYDITNPANIIELDRIQSNPGSNSTPHNTHIINIAGNDYAITAWYKDGVTIVDAGRPNNLIQVANYDTQPSSSGGGFVGAWGVYPYLPSGNLIVSDINSGLFILSPTYIRACYLEGTITDSVSGISINNARVELLSTPVKDSSGLTGIFATGIATPGIYDIKYSKTGYYSKLKTGTALNPGVVTTQNIELRPLSPCTISGHVIEAGTLLPVPFAKVGLKSLDFDFFVTADSNGNFSVSAYEDIYDVIGCKWSYQMTLLPDQNLNNLSGPLVIQLEKGYYDDFTFDLGWTTFHTALTGKWVRGIPKATIATGGIICNPGSDDSTDYDSKAYITGNGGGTVNSDNVTSGYTILTSPLFDLTTFIDPFLDYTRWFYCSGASLGNDDSLQIILSNGITETMVEYAVASTPNASTWQQRTFRITDYLLPTSTMQLQVYAADVGAYNDIIEAGFDKFLIREGSLSVIENSKEVKRIEIYPVPATEIIIVDTKNMLADRILIMDITGKVVMKIKPTQSLETIKLGDLSHGMYFIEVIFANEKEVKKIIKN